MFINKSESTIQNKISSMLRYTLTDLERDYQIRILSKGLYKKERRFYSGTLLSLLEERGGTLDNVQNATNINP